MWLDRGSPAGTPGLTELPRCSNPSTCMIRYPDRFLLLSLPSLAKPHPYLIRLDNVFLSVADSTTLCILPDLEKGPLSSLKRESHPYIRHDSGSSGSLRRYSDWFTPFLRVAYDRIGLSGALDIPVHHVFLFQTSQHLILADSLGVYTLESRHMLVN